MSRFGKIGDQYFDDAGSPLISGKLYFYESGTTTLKDTFSSVGLDILNTNPVVLTAAGRQPSIFFNGTARVVLTKSDDTQIEVRDPEGGALDTGGIPPWNFITIYSANDTVTGSDGNFYISIASGNQNNDPTASAANWSQVRFIRVWNANESYNIGQVTEGSDFALYSSVTSSNAGNDPVLDITQTNWKSAIPDDLIVNNLAVLTDINIDNAGAIKSKDFSGTLANIVHLDTNDDLQIGEATGVDQIFVNSALDQIYKRAGVEKHRVTSTGTLTTGVHEVTEGIKFPATQVPSADPNVIDDYEEGDWTATLIGTTTAPDVAVTKTCKYVKVGKKVTLLATYASVATTGATGELRVTGCPFVNNANIQNRVSGTTVVSGMITDPGTGVSSAMTNNADYLSLFRVGSMTSLSIIDSTAAYLFINLTYFV